MTTVEPGFGLLNSLFMLIDKKDFGTCLKKTQQLKKKYPRSIFLNVCEANCRARLNARENRGLVLSIYRKCLPYLKKQNAKIHDEILNLLNEVLMIYLKYEECYELHEMAMSKYKKNENPPEENLNMYFFSCVQANKLKEQQKTSQQLDKLYKKKRYSIWWGFSMILQVHDFKPGDNIPFLYKMGQRVFERNLYHVKNADPELIAFYVEFCNKLGSYEESIRILVEKVSSLYDSLPIDRKSILAKTYFLNGNYELSKLMFVFLLDTVDSEQWEWWIGLFDSHDKITEKESKEEEEEKEEKEISIEMNVENSKKHQLEKEDDEDDKFSGNSRLEIKDDLYVIKSPLSKLKPLQIIEKMAQKNPKYRTPYLALLEYLYRQQQQQQQSDTTPLMVQCVEYYDRFGHLSSCFVDLKKYTSSLSVPSKEVLITQLEELRKSKLVEGEKSLGPLESKMKGSLRKEKEDLKRKKKKKKRGMKNKKPQPKEFNREEQVYIKQVQANINLDLNFFKFQKLVIDDINLVEEEEQEEQEGEEGEGDDDGGGKKRKKVEMIKKTCQTLYQNYETSVKKYSKYIQKATSNQFGDDYLLLLVQYLIYLYHETNETCHLYEAVKILEEGLKKSRFHYEFKVFLLRLLTILGDYKRTVKLYLQDIELKHAQNQSLSYLLVYDMILNHPKKTFLKYINGKQHLKRWYREIQMNVPGILLKAYRNRSWSRVLEAERFQNDVNCSLTNHQMVVWKVYLEMSVSYFTNKNQRMNNVTELFDEGQMWYLKDYLKILPNYVIKEDTGIFEMYSSSSSSCNVKNNDLPFILPSQLGMDGEGRVKLLNALKCVLFLILPTSVSDTLYDLPTPPPKKKKKKKKKKGEEEEEEEEEESVIPPSKKRRIEVIQLFHDIVSSPEIKKYEKYQKPLQVLRDTVMFSSSSSSGDDDEQKYPSSVEIRKKVDQYLAYLVRCMKTVEPDLIKINRFFIQPMMFFLRFILKPIMILNRLYNKNESKKQKKDFYNYVGRRLRSMNKIYDVNALKKKKIQLLEFKNNKFVTSKFRGKFSSQKGNSGDVNVKEEVGVLMNDLFDVLRNEVVDLAFDISSTKI